MEKGSAMDGKKETGSLRLLILAPTGRDADVLARTFEENGVSAKQCSCLATLCSDIAVGAGAVLITCEALEGKDTTPLKQVLSAQEEWSDFPLIIVTSRNMEFGTGWEFMRDSKICRYVQLIERPVSTAVLVTTVRSALSSRERQYRLRDELAARRQKEKELEKSRQEYREMAIQADRLKSLGQMTASMAHELNQPLMGIRNMAEHLKIGVERGWELTAETLSRTAGDIVEQGDRISHVIEHARMFARGGKEGLEKEPSSVSEICENAARFLQAQMKSRGITFKVEIADDLPAVMVHPFSLEQVIMNLLNNARDALTVMTAREPAVVNPTIELKTDLHERDGIKFVRILVIDDGPGMDEETLEKVFQPFYSTKDPKKGTGLGLVICKTLVEQFDGELEIDSKPGEGTEVGILLPPA